MNDRDLNSKLRSWVLSFPGMVDDKLPVREKYQPLYSSITTTILNGSRLLLMGINPGMPSDFSRGLADWVQHLPAYRIGLFQDGSHYHSFMDYHPNGKVVKGFENMLRQTIEDHVPLTLLPNTEWLRSIPVTNLFLRATNREAKLGPLQEERNALPLVNMFCPSFLVWMGSSNAKCHWLVKQGIVTDLQEHVLPFTELRGRNIIIRTARTTWGGSFIAVPHSNAISGHATQKEVGSWLHANWEALIC